MPDTANPGAPAAGQPDADTTPAPTPQDLADRLNKPDPWDAPETARAEIERLRREAAGWRTKLREVEPIVEASKTDTQRLEDRAGSAERERDELRAQVARLAVAAEVGIPAEFVDMLGAGDDEQIRQRARLIAERLTAQTATGAPRVRPVESLTPGAAPAAAETDRDPNAWFRDFLSSARSRP
ncbi:hypothetical protein SMC26_40340 [Actinomadura fulvescens]|uniref:Uncharacterized protein n=1 Tax=Actinomadura fulvescens TaxID=46160 RepID=A0ABN3Q989_9ACTN